MYNLAIHTYIALSGNLSMGHVPANSCLRGQDDVDVIHGHSLHSSYMLQQLCWGDQEMGTAMYAILACTHLVEGRHAKQN